MVRVVEKEEEGWMEEGWREGGVERETGGRKDEMRGREN